MLAWCLRFRAAMSAHGLPISRRKYPRLEVLGRIEGQVLALDAKLSLRELSKGGFSANSDRPFAPGMPHAFRFTTANGLVVELSGMSVHCRIGSISNEGRQAYIAGFEWIEEPGSDEKIAGLLDVVTLAMADN
jgi:hypothetical protein